MRILPFIFILTYLGATSFLFGKSSDIDPNNLIVAVDGPISLLWKKENRTYHFYSKKNGEIIELSNSEINGKSQEEYKEVLRVHSDNMMNVEQVKLNLRSLTNFYLTYNNLISNPNFREAKIEHRVGLAGGLDEAGTVYNPQNIIHPIIAVEYELSEAGAKRRFSVAFKFTHILKDSEHDYSASKLSFNYRLKLIRSSKLDVFLNTNIAEYQNSRYSIDSEPSEASDEIKKLSNHGSGFTSPLGFGLGADYKIGKGYLNFLLNDAVSLNTNTNNNFSLNLSLGYKLIL